MYQEDIDLARALQFVTELGEQLSHNQKIVAALQNQTSQLKVSSRDKVALCRGLTLVRIQNQAIHNGTGYALRRFNIDLSKGALITFLALVLIASGFRRDLRV